MNSHVQVFVWTWVLHFSEINTQGYNYLVSFTNHPTIFHGVCPILHSHQQNTSDPVSPQPRQHLESSLFFIFATLWVVLICISLVTNDVEHLFTCFLTVYLSWNVFLFMSFAHFLNGLFVFLQLSFESSLYILNIILVLCQMAVCKYSLPLCSLSFHPLTGSSSTSKNV